MLLLVTCQIPEQLSFPEAISSVHKVQTDLSKCTHLCVHLQIPVSVEHRVGKPCTLQSNLHSCEAALSFVTCCF